MLESFIFAVKVTILVAFCLPISMGVAVWLGFLKAMKDYTYYICLTKSKDSQKNQSL